MCRLNSPLSFVLLVEGSNVELVGVTSDVVDRNRCVQLQVKFWKEKVKRKNVLKSFSLSIFTVESFCVRKKNQATGKFFNVSREGRSLLSIKDGEG